MCMHMYVCVCVFLSSVSLSDWLFASLFVFLYSVTGGELFEDIVAREYYSEADARWALQFSNLLLPWLLLCGLQQAGHTHTHAHTRKHTFVTMVLCFKSTRLMSEEVEALLSAVKEMCSLMMPLRKRY